MVLKVWDSSAPGSTPKKTAIRPAETARCLVEASVSPNSLHAYAGALRRLDAWLDGREFHDVTLAAPLAELQDVGGAAASASMAVTAGYFRAKLAGQPTPAGERTARDLLRPACYCPRREHGNRRKTVAAPPDAGPHR